MSARAVRPPAPDLTPLFARRQSRAEYAHEKVHHPPQIQKYFIVINQFPQSHRLLTRRGQVIMVRAVLKGRATGTASGAQGS